MKQIIFLLLFVPFFCEGQNALVKRTLEHKIKINPEDPVKSVFEWVAKNIKYDVKKLRKFQHSGDQKTTQTVDERLNDVLTTKKGVCQHYSELFAALLTELGYEAKVVTGYTNMRSSEVESTLGHAWNAVKINDEWKLYDVTWASGGVRNGKKFIGQYNPEWHNVLPKKMIESHMPNDPMWQLLENPINYPQFSNDQFKSTFKGNYDFKTLIEQHFEKSELEQMKDELERSKLLGKPNEVVQRWQNIRKQNILVFEKNEKVKIHNKFVEERNDQITILNKGINIMKSNTDLFNQYVKAKNKGLKGAQWTKKRLVQTMQKLNEETLEAIKIFYTIKTSDPNLKQTVLDRISHAKNLQSRIKEETLFVNSYVKGKS